MKSTTPRVAECRLGLIMALVSYESAITKYILTLIAVGRGVLIDYWSYAKKSYDPNTTHAITLKNLLECAKQQKIEFQYGDILIIRSGWLDNYNKLDTKARETLPTVKPTFVGVEQTQEMLDFLHDNYFSAVVGDTPAFEAWPTNQDWFCHQYLISLWGSPIGEMWDLEKLAETCKQSGKYAFYFSSMPANVPGEFPPTGCLN
jgi:kynurenine formamidase